MGWASSEGRKEASGGRSAVTTQEGRASRLAWGQSIPLAFLAPLNADGARRNPWPLPAGVPRLIPHHPTLLALLEGCWLCQ